jgi:hypothetical protein
VEVAAVTVTDRPERNAHLVAVHDDVCRAGRVAELRTVSGDELHVEVVFADAPRAAAGS